MRSTAPIIFTKEGYEKLLTEQTDLIESRKVAVEDLAKARAMGDLSENGYYKSARAKLSSIDRRFRELKHLIRFGKVKEAAIDGTVDIGSIVVLQTGTIERTFSIVGGYESNPSEGKLSHISPLGSSLIGKRKGDVVNIKTPSGNIAYTIVSAS